MDVIGLLLFLLFVIANAALGTQRNSRRRSVGWEEVFRELTSRDRQGERPRVGGARTQRPAVPPKGTGQPRSAAQERPAGLPEEGTSAEWSWELAPVEDDQAGRGIAAGLAGLAQAAPDMPSHGEASASAVASVAVRLLRAPAGAGGLPGAAVVLHEVLGPPRARRPWRPQAGAKRA